MIFLEPVLPLITKPGDAVDFSQGDLEAGKTYTAAIELVLSNTKSVKIESEPVEISVPGRYN